MLANFSAIIDGVGTWSANLSFIHTLLASPLTDGGHQSPYIQLSEKMISPTAHPLTINMDPD